MLDINLIDKEIINKMDNQENFFKTFIEMENKNGREWILKWLYTSDYVNNFIALNKNKQKDKTIICKQILAAINSYKRKGSWRNQKVIIRKLIKASQGIK